MRTGNPPDELEKVLVIFRVLRAGYRVVLLRLVLKYLTFSKTETRKVKEKQAKHPRMTHFTSLTSLLQT